MYKNRMNISCVAFLFATVMFFCFSLHGCAPHGYTKVKNSTDRIESQGFSVLPPTGPDWYMKQGQNFIGFGKNLGSRTHTVSIIAIQHAELQPELVGYGEYATNPEIFAAYVKSSIEHMNPPTGRIRIVELSTSPDTRYGYCTKFHAVMEDHGSPVAPQVLKQEEWGYHCLQPGSPRNLIEVGFSERGLPGESDPALANVRDQFFDNLRIN